MSIHTDNVVYKREGGRIHYYITQDGKKVEISNYNGRTYTLNGKTYNAKTMREITNTDATGTGRAGSARSKGSAGSAGSVGSAGSTVKSQADLYAEQHGYTKYTQGPYSNIYSKDNKYYTFVNNSMKQVTRFMSGSYYQVGNTTYDSSGKAVSSVKLGGGTYTTSNGRESGSSSASISYGGTRNNNIAKEEFYNNSSTADKDAQWHINGGRYNLYIDDSIVSDTCLDYYDIRGTRSLGQNRSHAFVGSDGYLNPMATMFDYGKDKVYFDGSGEFAGCALKRIQDTNGNYQLCVEKNGTYYDLNILMRTGEKVSVRPGTFISQGR